MAKLNNRQIVNYTNVFGDAPGNVKDLLRGINKSTAIKLIARLNHVFRSRQIASVSEVLNMWFGTSNLEFRMRMHFLIDQGYRKLNIPIERLTIISIWTNLNLLDLLLSETENTGPKKSDDESERDFFKAYLSVNEIFGTGSNAMVSTLEPYKANTASWYARSLITTMLKYHDVAHLSPKELLYPQIIRAYHCFQFLETRGHKQLLALFLEEYGLRSWQQYFASILPIAKTAYTEGDKSGLFYFDIRDSPNQEQANQFIRKLALTGMESYDEKPDFLHVRSMPLYETEPNRYIVCDPILAVQRINNSMYFELMKINDKSEKLNTRQKNFSSFYTTEFVEHYLAYEVLNDIFADSGVYYISGEDIKQQYKINQEPDYYVRNGNKVFIFEVKGSILAGSVKQNFDYQVIDADLKQKFYRKEKDGKKTNIGVTQLVDRIRLLLDENKKVRYDKIDDLKNLEIYPILLCTERSLSVPGMNHLFNEWFEQALGEENELSEKHYQIKPLTIMDIDTLINFSKMFKNNKLFMERSIRAYHQFINFKMPIKGSSITREQAITNMNSAMRSYTDFLQSNYNPDGPDLYDQIAKEIVAFRDDVND